MFLRPFKPIVVIAAAGIGVFLSMAAVAQEISPITAADIAAGRDTINGYCAGCHGEDGSDGSRAPSLVDSSRLRNANDKEIGEIILNGTDGGMPPFPLNSTQLAQAVAYIRASNPSDLEEFPAEQIAAGKSYYFGDGGCSDCHMIRGRGKVSGPDLSDVASRLTLAEMGSTIEDPTAQMGMKTTTWCPGWAFCADIEWQVVNVELTNGQNVRGFARNQGEHDLQLQTLDGKFQLLTEHQYVSIKPEASSYMPPFKGTPNELGSLLAFLSTLKGVPLGPLPDAHQSPAIKSNSDSWDDWPTYDGRPDGNRYSGLSQINAQNVDQLQAEWIFAPGGSGLQNTPIVVDGVMYVTGAARVCALDARNGRRIWCAPRMSGQTVPAGNQQAGPRSPEQIAKGEPAPFGGLSKASGPNRGVAVSGDRVFFVSDDAYLVSLNRVTGAVMWIQALPDPDYKGDYFNTAAPLIVGDLVVAGMAGGDTPLRGFLIAFDAATGEMAWRFWTIPGPGEPGSETWPDRALPTGGGATWTTGSFDAEANVLYWAVGNPFPDSDSAERPGENLYTNSVVALNPETGEPIWHFQFTPHDLHDWDANQPLVLADTIWKGKQRKLLMQANRNGYFYVLDRLTGEYLLGAPYVKKLTWSSGIDKDGKPILTDNNWPTVEGIVTCPAVRGATNWYASSFNPSTRLFYVMAAEDCSTYFIATYGWRPYRNPKDPSARFVRALDIESGEVVWQKPLIGAQEANYTGVLSTAGDLLFHGETGGRFAAVDAKTGRTLWTFPANDFPRASPMSYAVDGRQFVAVAMGSNIIAFTLRESERK
ncbi:MAG TPA: PQQ-binding-like beta-propeller repeat protein [Woeseiaceae bacterium]|nr:PQQ-binding-like beta-propeller repeat protein [Woeseiaceae bacterium]